MPRRPRGEEPDAIYHVFARGVNRQRVFVDDEDYQRYTSILGATIARKGWHCLSYCLMPNHMHLLIETPQPNLGAGMQWLQGLYAQTFNERHDRVGHVFQDRYRSERITDGLGLVRVVGYIALNPVAAVLCTHPGEWRWGSHTAVSSGHWPAWVRHNRLCEHLESTTGFDCYRELIDARMRLVTDTTLK
jgi:putative transposase